MTLILDLDARKQSLLESAVRDAVRGLERDDWPSFCLDRAVGRVVVIVARPEQLPAIAAGLMEAPERAAVEDASPPASTSAGVTSAGTDVPAPIPSTSEAA